MPSRRRSEILAPADIPAHGSSLLDSDPLRRDEARRPEAPHRSEPDRKSTAFTIRIPSTLPYGYLSSVMTDFG